MPDESCRIAKLEAYHAYHAEHFRQFEEHIKREERNFDALFTSIKDLEISINGQKSFIGGVVFVLSGVAAAATILINKYL